MATITLRPTADVTIGHSKYEGSGTSRSAAYTLIDDVVSDEDATTIQQRHHSTSVTSKSSTFKLGGDTYGHKIFVNSIKLYNDYFCSNPATKGGMTSIGISMSVSINGTESSEIKNTISDIGTSSDSGSYKQLTYTFTPSNYEILNSVFDSIQALNLQFTIKTEWKCSSSNVTQDQIMKVSQVYAVIDYTDAYTMTAVGNDTVDVISPGAVKDGSTVVFDATPKLNHKFVGWYSDSSHSSLVTTGQTYSYRVNGKDYTLYANGKRIEAINVYTKKNGKWTKVNSLFIKENGHYREITAQEFGNSLYFSDKSYMKGIE